MTPQADGRPRVAIFRLQAFKPSETFIGAQAGALRRWSPVFVGARDHGGARRADADFVQLPQTLSAQARAGLLRDLGPLAEPLRRRGVRLIHAHFAPDAVFALPLARALGIPLVATLHGFDVTRSDRSLLASSRLPLLWSLLGRRELQHGAAAFVAVSDFVAERARERGFPRERLHTLPIGVALHRPALDAPRQPGLIVHVGRLVEKKGTGALLSALARLLAQGCDAKLAIVGEGPLRARLEEQARRLGVSDRVCFHGALPHPATLALIGQASVLAAPSRPARDGDREGLPTVILEAMALGTPVVATREAGIPEAVDDEVSGLLARSDDVDGLTQGLGRVLRDPPLALALSTAARRTVEQRFDLQAQTAALERLYDGVVAQASPP